MKKILVVDDNPSVVQLLKDVIASAGHMVSTATSGTQALVFLKKEPVDLMICDVWMPGMTGLELLAAIHKLPEEPPVIMLTADDTPETVLKAIREHARQYVTKPFEAAEMLELIQNTLDMGTAPPIEVISARPDWVEIMVPCDIRTADRIQSLMLKLKSDLPEEVRESVGRAFRELLMNAIEWGGKLDVNRKVRISFLRAKRMLLYRIADPGAGFRFEELAHAAVSNSPDDPIGHMRIREEMGLRPGGLGILIAKSLVDELIYNEAQNEVVFIKYLD